MLTSTGCQSPGLAANLLASSLTVPMTLLLCGHLLLSSAAGANKSVALSAETTKPNTSTYVAGEPAQITFSISHLGPHQESNLSVSILNEFGNESTAPITVKVVADSFGNAAYLAAMPTAKFGYYEVHAQLADGTTLPALGTRPSGFITYAVVPDPARRVDYGDTDSRFGMQGGFSASANVVYYLGARYILQNGAGWAALEPDYPGEYSAQRQLAIGKGSLHPAPEPAVHSPEYNGKSWTTYYLTMITNASLPAWAIRQGTTGKICKTFGALSLSARQPLTQFARAAATAFHADYGDQTRRYYQVTWEPAADWCFRGSAADLVQMYSLVYAAIHRVDPGAVIAGPTLFPDDTSTTQLRDLWNANLGRFVDALSIHPYTDWPPEAGGRFLKTLRLQIREAGKAIGHDIPFIGTEHGYRSAQLGNVNAALGDIRSTIMMIGEGAQFDFGFYLADFWDGSDPAKNDGYGYYWNLNPRIVWGTDKIGPKAVVPAYAAMTYFLDGTVSDGPIKQLRGSQVGYRFHRRNNSTILAIWDPEGSSSFTVGSGLFVCDWMGNCSLRTKSSSIINIGQAPTYIIDTLQ